VFQSPDLVVSPVDARGDLERFVASARHSLDLYAEELQDHGMEGALSARAHAGVHVRVLLPPSALHGPGSPSTELRRQLNIRTLANPYIHAKVIILDNRYLFVGSENMSSTSLDRNREVGVFLRGAVVSRVAGVFRRDWTETAASGR
jgi:phosphatidylserine/phosphatidylglycerophosphate/cardiolipin synthase-like enzyme